MLTEIETAIANQVNAALDGYHVTASAFPDNPRDNLRATPRARVLVSYRGATFADQGEEPIAQTMLQSWEVSIQVANLRSHTGAYPLLDIVRRALTDFIPIAGPVRPMRPRSERFVALEQGIWYYLIEFVLPLAWPAEYAAAQPQGPWEISGVEVGLWRSLIGGVADPERSNLDTELIIDASS